MFPDRLEIETRVFVYVCLCVCCKSLLIYIRISMVYIIGFFYMYFVRRLKLYFRICAIEIYSLFILLSSPFKIRNKNCAWFDTCDGLAIPMSDTRMFLAWNKLYYEKLSCRSEALALYSLLLLQVRPDKAAHWFKKLLSFFTCCVLIERRVFCSIIWRLLTSSLVLT